MSEMGGVYVCRRAYQTICKGTDERGELVWDSVMMEPWQQKMFPVPYGGDFGVEWMYKSMQEKGIEWDAPETIDNNFARTARKLLKRIKR